MGNLHGYAGLVYQVNSHAHQAVLQLQDGVDPIADAIPIRDELQDIADAIGLAMCDNTNITGYKIFNNAHVLLTEDLLTTPVVGAISVGANNPAYNSLTVSLTGKGPPQSTTTPGGNTILRWVCSGAFGNVETLLNLVVADHAALAATAVILSATNYVWGDFYGVRATVRAFAPLQYNAALQRRLGG
jgi:hypothetical protein